MTEQNRRLRISFAAKLLHRLAYSTVALRYKATIPIHDSPDFVGSVFTMGLMIRYQDQGIMVNLEHGSRSLLLLARVVSL